MDQLLHHLRHLGFTEMESKIMVELARQGSASGYEVAKRLGVSRSNVYATLQRLEQRGFLRCSPGEPAKYSVLKPEEMTRMISDQMHNSLAYVERSMPQSVPEKPVFYNVEGDKKVFESLSRELASAQHEIVVNVWREEAKLLQKDLQHAESRGVRLLWSYEGGEGLLDQPLPLPGMPISGTGRKFSLVVDRRWCMLGMRGDSCPTQAVVTEHPVMTGLLLSHFAQELVLYELEQDIGRELEGRYGQQYANIAARYWSSFSPKNEQ